MFLCHVKFQLKFINCISEKVKRFQNFMHYIYGKINMPRNKSFILIKI